MFWKTRACTYIHSKGTIFSRWKQLSFSLCNVSTSARSAHLPLSSVRYIKQISILPLIPSTYGSKLLLFVILLGIRGNSHPFLPARKDRKKTQIIDLFLLYTFRILKFMICFMVMRIFHLRGFQTVINQGIFFFFFAIIHFQPSLRISRPGLND